MEKYRAPIGEVVARMKEHLDTACFGSADADDARRLIEEYERPAQAVADVDEEIELLEGYRAFFTSTMK